MKGGREPTGVAGDLSSADRSVRKNNPIVRTKAWSDPLSKRKVPANSTRKSTANSSGKKRSSSRGSKKHGHRSEKRGHGKSCPGPGISIKDGLDNILEKLRIKLTEGERNRVEGAMKKAGKGKGGCNTVAVKKLFDGEVRVKNRAMIAYNKLKDGEGIKSNLTQGLKRLADGKITKADKECLDMPDESLEKNYYCKNSNNPQVKSRLDKLKANLQSKIKEEQAKIAKQAEEKAERDRQRQMRTNRNRKMKKCVSDSKELYAELDKALPIKRGMKIEDLDLLYKDVQIKIENLKQECDQFKSGSTSYKKTRTMVLDKVASLQNAIKTKRKELAEKKAAAEKAKQEEALAAKKLAVEVENKRLADEAKKKEQKEKLEAEAAEKKRLAAEAQDKREKELAEKEAETARLKVVEAENKRKEAEEKALIEKQKKKAAEKKAEQERKLAAEQALKAENLRLEKIAAENKAAEEKKKTEEARIKADLAENKVKEEAEKLKIEAEKKLKIETEKLEAEKKKEAAEAKQNEERERLEAEKLEAKKLEAEKEKEAQTLLKTAEITHELKLKEDALKTEKEINEKNTESLKKIESELRSLKRAVDKNSTAEEQKILKSLEETIKSWITHKVK